MTKPILVVTSRYPKEVEDRIDGAINHEKPRSTFVQSPLPRASRTQQERTRDYKKNTW